MKSARWLAARANEADASFSSSCAFFKPLFLLGEIFVPAPVVGEDASKLIDDLVHRFARVRASNAVRVL
ncbi:hypothetical protein DXU07_24725 [Bradyrhizobium elkanii]|jgi:hypothetical protein|uniref:hypothetical protein n=1 Tax=Bradyrhizobium elkanii TaxID=29448 RepID=UPI0002E4018C|nr:hypothetical protein [Bradyrhizobium elkanii]NWL39184.1 hypothetical protein [Bradyrhizobium elkanii]NWL68721.1 hypothetical protein [Bradyrhizobium elkanii]OIM89292.1 hypothetical protein BLN97_40125 [Bradyrhizobium elkanii]RYM16449.1 hypothetical protein EWH13_42615 [Bradyrhizobium elkanii]